MIPKVISASELQNDYRSDVTALVDSRLSEISLALSHFLKANNTRDHNTVNIAFYRDYSEGGKPLYTAQDETSPLVPLNRGFVLTRKSEVTTEAIEEQVKAGFDAIVAGLVGYTVEPFDAWAKVLDTSLDVEGHISIARTFRRIVVYKVSWSNVLPG